MIACLYEGSAERAILDILYKIIFFLFPKTICLAVIS